MRYLAMIPGLLLFAVPVLAQRPQSPPDPFLTALDRDADGVVSAEELERAPQSLRRIDRNRDGQIDPSEIRDAMRQLMLRMRQPGNFGRGQGGMRGGAPGGRRGGGGGPGTPGASSLERTGLQAGKKLPVANVFDGDGKPFSTSQLEGKHAVIVFGCLT